MFGSRLERLVIVKLGGVLRGRCDEHTEEDIKSLDLYVSFSIHRVRKPGELHYATQVGQHTAANVSSAGCPANFQFVLQIVDPLVDFSLVVNQRTHVVNTLVGRFLRKLPKRDQIVRLYSTLLCILRLLLGSLFLEHDRNLILHSIIQTLRQKRTSSCATIFAYAALVSFKNISFTRSSLASSAEASVRTQDMIRSSESSSIGTAANWLCPTRMTDVIMSIDYS